MTQHLNLYHPGLEPPRARWSAAHGLMALGAVAALMVLGGALLKGLAYLARSEQTTLQAALDTQRERLLQAGQHAGLPADAQRELQRLRQLAAGEQRLRAAIDTGEAGAGTGFSPELIALARQAHHQVWLTGINLDRAGNGLALSGRTTDPAALPDYLQSLQTEAALRGRPFAQMQVRADGQDAAGQPLPYAEFSVRSTPAAPEATARTPGVAR